MNPEAILALISDLYAQLHAAQQRATAAEQRVAELTEASRSADPARPTEPAPSAPL